MALRLSTIKRINGSPTSVDMLLNTRFVRSVWVSGADAVINYNSVTGIYEFLTDDTSYWLNVPADDSGYFGAAAITFTSVNGVASSGTVRVNYRDIISATDIDGVSSSIKCLIDGRSIVYISSIALSALESAASGSTPAQGLDDVLYVDQVLTFDHVIDTGDHHFTIDSGTGEIRLYGRIGLDQSAVPTFYSGARNRVFFNKPDPASSGPPLEAGMVYQFSQGKLSPYADPTRTLLLVTDYNNKSLYLGIDGGTSMIGMESFSNLRFRAGVSYGSSNIITSGYDIFVLAGETGEAILSKYGIGTHTGVVAKHLAVTATGSIIEVDPDDIASYDMSMLLMGG